MKIPGIGEVKPVYVWSGAGVVGGIVVYAMVKRKRAANAAASSIDSSTGDSTDSSVDPTTGLPYADEGGVYGYGAIDPTTGVPYQYESGTTTAVNSGSTITTNQQWLGQAEQDAQNVFGATYALASGALGKYLAQSSKGLSDSEFLLVQEVVAELGQPPVGGPFRLIHTPSTPTTPPGGGPIPAKRLVPGMTLHVPYLVAPGTMGKVASKFGISLQHLLNENPSLTGKEKTTVTAMVPVLVKQGMTEQSIARDFGISVQHLGEFIPDTTSTFG